MKNELYTNEIGAPQLPVKKLCYVIPNDKMVSNITINNTMT